MSAPRPDVSVARLAGEESVNAVVEIAHDIRSPLTSILFLADTIRRGHSGKVTPVQERQLGLIYGAALGLSTMSSDLIDAVRGERLVDGQPLPFSLTDVLLGVQAIVQPIAEEKGLQFAVQYPSRDGRIGYPSAIGRVLLNLTSNALRYTETGSVVVGCAEHSERVIEFSVKDTGRGIPESVLAMLFDGFRPASGVNPFLQCGALASPTAARCSQRWGACWTWKRPRMGRASPSPSSCRRSRPRRDSSVVPAPCDEACAGGNGWPSLQHDFATIGNQIVVLSDTAGAAGAAGIAGPPGPAGICGGDRRGRPPPSATGRAPLPAMCR